MPKQYIESELVKEFQNNRINYLNKVKENEDLRRQMQRQKLESYSYWYIFKILAYRLREIYRKIRSLFGHSKIMEKKTAAPGQAKFNHDPYQIKVPYKPGTPSQRILHVIPTFSTGGSQQLVVDLIENLSAGYEHHIMTAYEHGPIGYLGVPIQLIDANNWGYETKMDAYMKELDPDLVHIHNWSTLEPIFEWRWYHAAFQCCFNNNIKVIQNCNNPTFPYFDSRILANVYVSHYAKDTFGIDAPQNMVIYPGSNFSMFKREGAFVPGDTIGMVYRLEKDKLNEKSIEPFIETVKRRPQTKALIVGGGTWFDLYNNRVREEGLMDNFEFTGYVSYQDLPKYYERMSLFVTPVHKESFGQVTPFAMNMGIPVAGYRIGALPEIIADESLLATPGDAVALAEVMVDLLNNKDRMLRTSAYNQQRASELFSLETMATEYQKLYHQILREEWKS